MTESTSAAREPRLRADKRHIEMRAAQDATPTPEPHRGCMGRVSGVKIAATGSYVPEEIVTNEDLAAFGYDSEWILRRTGIRQRRRAADDQATSDLCYEAALRCMREANVTADQIDLVIVATITPDHPTPSTACSLQRQLGAIAPAMDINAACGGFMHGLVTAAQFVATRNSRCALVVGADLMSRTINPDDKKTYPLFGDAAGAVILTPDAGSAGILSYQLGSERHDDEMSGVPTSRTHASLAREVEASGAPYLVMDGRNVFNWAVRVFDESARQVINHAGIDAKELGLVILHQADQRIIDSAISDLDVSAEKVFVNLDRYGNTSGASIPLALDEAVRGGKICSGDFVLLSGFDAGRAWGTALLQY
jgi:3-oxoacyl-[acyl-carrier-protein] synthase-3